jgi:hypothetical protein
MERVITQRFGPEELERVALLYGQDIDAGTLAKFEKSAVQKTSLTGTFGADMPADSDNHGTYLYCDSPLGSAAVYTERFGGRYDLAAMLREQEKAFNLFWDTVLLRLDELVGDSTDYAALRSFVDTTMRADMWDLALELTLSDLGADATRNLSGFDEMPDDIMAKFMRALHFLDARGYIPLQDALGQAAAAEGGSEDGLALALQILGQAVGRRMGMEDGAMPAAFEALMDYTEEQLLEESPGSLDALADQAFLFDFDLLELAGDARDVTLYLPVEPYLTNGAWIEADATDAPDSEEIATSGSGSYVEWQYPLASIPPDGDLAQVVYAFWAAPTEAYQVEHFGKLVLDKNSLADQCGWRQALGPSLRDEWDAFIDGLRPGPNLATTLREFRFSIEEPFETNDPNAIHSRIARNVTSHLASNVPSFESQN